MAPVDVLEERQAQLAAQLARLQEAQARLEEHFRRVEMTLARIQWIITGMLLVFVANTAGLATAVHMLLGV